MPDGIKIHPNSEQDYRPLTKLFDHNKLPYHTYKLKSENNMKVVLRGLPNHIKTDSIEEDLKREDYNPIKITRMTKKGTQDGQNVQIPMPLVLVEIGKDQRHIYDITNCCSLTVKPEPLKRSTSTTLPRFPPRTKQLQGSRKMC